MKYIIEYCGQTAMVSSVEESINAIQSFHNYGGKNNPLLVVNHNTLASLTELFDKGSVRGSKFPWLRTTNCGNKDIRFFEPLGDTIEEHEANYRAKCEAEKAERIRIAEEAKQRLLAEYNEVRRGWYRVEVSISALLVSNGRRVVRDFVGKVVADSKMDAYNKAIAQMDDYCAERGYIFESAEKWNSSLNDIEFLGMKTDEGYSLAAWEEFSKTDEYKE